MQKFIHNLKWLTLSIVMGIVIGGGLIAVKAWTEPTVAPPGGNIGAPINTGINGQMKLGALQVNGFRNYLGATVLDGNVGIGTTANNTGLKLDVEGKVGATEYCDQDGNNCKAITSVGNSNAIDMDTGFLKGYCTLNDPTNRGVAVKKVGSDYYARQVVGNLTSYPWLKLTYESPCFNILVQGACWRYQSGSFLATVKESTPTEFTANYFPTPTSNYSCAGAVAL